VNSVSSNVEACDYLSDILTCNRIVWCVVSRFIDVNPKDFGNV